MSGFCFGQILGFLDGVLHCISYSSPASAPADVSGICTVIMQKPEPHDITHKFESIALGLCSYAYGYHCMQQ